MHRYWQKLRSLDRAALFGWACVVIITTAYTVIVFNRFMPPQEGWFNAFSRRILSGEMPYRDFYLFLQPIYPYLLAALNAVFGYDFMVFRVYGIFERIFLVSMVYLVYGRVFKPWIAAFCAVASLVLCWSFNADAVCSYYQLSVALVLLSLWLLLKFFDEEAPTRRLFFLVSAGFACSLSFMVKQTLGFAFPFVAIVLIVLHSMKVRDSSRRLFKHLALFAAGCASVIALLWALLLLTGSFDEYISQVYLGTSSKGTLVSILFGAEGRLFDNHLHWALLFLAVMTASAVIYGAMSRCAGRARSSSAERCDNIDSYMWIAAILLLLVSLVLPRLFLSSLENTRLSGGGLFDIKRSFVYALFPVSIMLGIFYFHRTMFTLRPDIARLSIAATSFAIIYVHGFSGMIEETSTILIFGFAVGLALAYKGLVNLAKQVIVLLFVAGIMLVCSVQRMTWPYGWWGWHEPSVSAATHTVNIPRMPWIYMSEDTADMYQTIYDDLKGQIGSDDYLYSFPHIKAFDNIFGTVPPTFADVHYWDVCPDDVALADCEILRAQPPKAIVYMDLTEEAWSTHERVFRNGAESGQRAIKQLIDEGIQSGQYMVLSEIPASEGATILVLLRNDT